MNDICEEYFHIVDWSHDFYDGYYMEAKSKQSFTKFVMLYPELHSRLRFRKVHSIKGTYNEFIDFISAYEDDPNIKEYLKNNKNFIQDIKSTDMFEACTIFPEHYFITFEAFIIKNDSRENTITFIHPCTSRLRDGCVCCINFTVSTSELASRK